MRLTKVKALELTAEMWDWLSENPDMHKADWIGWEKYHINRREISHSCFLCQHTSPSTPSKSFPKMTDDVCKKKCPLYGKWVEGDDNSHCEDKESPYTLWQDEEYAQKENAKKIADLAREQLAVLRSKKCAVHTATKKP